MRSKTLFAIGTLAVAGILFTGYTLTKADENPKPIPKAETVKKVVDPNPNKKWKDSSINAKGWVAFEVNAFSKTDPKISKSEYDEGYDYYLKAQSVSNVVRGYVRVEGGDLEKDFENLRELAGIIEHEQFVRTDHIDPDGKAMDKTEYIKQWKPVNERMRRSYEYMTKLLNDIDVAINKDGKGKTFGVSHQLDGDKTSEMESFMAYFEEDGENRK
ncbi:hypothetical protein [Ectobacillus panaciterrae]|uniref:hypothetical protein n=1 Tax=Ectobacillus panaciterrae TaxID=363872 RepID=UPI001FE050AE|nr:hypothetical protein [Ectobacillus panaciterrae]